MLTLTATKPILTWLEQNLAQYQVPSTNKTITHSYQTETKKGEKFKIDVYTTNTLTITGNISERIYSSLIKASNEINVVGCDEVGVGDFLGPTVYASVKLDQAALNYLSTQHLPIRDSKKLTDPQIIEMYNKLVNKIEFHHQVVFDYEIDNLNSIAQKVYYHFENVFDYEEEQIIIDLFTTEKSFYKYSHDLDIKWTDNIVLETKADGKYLSVALASIIARAIFLQEMSKLEEKYNFELPFGAGNKVKLAAQEFVNKYGKDELATFAKTSFKTFNELD